MSHKNNKINGSNGDDVLVGDEGKNKIYGKGGDDELRGLGGDDFLDGGSGNDLLSGGDDKDLIDGGSGDDVIDGGEGKDLVFGNSGDDIVAGGNDDDLVGGGRGNDTLTGGEGKDGLWGGRGDDILEGGSGNDRLYGGKENDSLSGGEGNDRLYGNSGNDILTGGEGNDRLYGSHGNDTLTGGAGNDRIRGDKGDDHIIWSAGDGNDDIDGGRGNDTFTLNTSDNVAQVVQLDTNHRGDLVVTIDGEEGADLTLEDIENFNLQVGQAGASIVLGDIPDGTLGDEPLDLGGGEGSDEIDASGSDTAVNIDAGTGDDAVTGGNAADEISGGEGSDTITGGGGDDVIDAGTGNDTIVWQAGDGNDFVDGGEGEDQIELNLDDENSTTPSSLSVQKDSNGNVVLVSSDGSTLTLDQVEEVVITAATAGTTITIGDLTGTDISQNTLYFNGGAGIDSLDASATDRRIVASGEGGDDILLSGSGNDTLDGGAGNDSLDAGSGQGVDTVLGGSGDDQISVTLGDEQGSDAIDIIDGGDDVDSLNVHFTEPTPHDLFLNVFSNGDGTFTITSEDIDVDEEVLVSNVEHLVISADEPGLNFILGTLSDTSLVQNGVEFQGSAGNDSFNGSGTDVSLSLIGNDGDDNLIGGSQGDHFDGGTGNDSLDGEDGDDWLIGGEGNDIIDGGAGWDTADYSQAASGVTVDLGDIAAQNTGGAGSDTLVNVEAVEGSSLADTLTGDANDNYLSGNDGDDIIMGGDGFDTSRGGAGNDTITDDSGRISGDAGNDTLSGPITYIHDGNGVAVNMSATDIDVDGTTIVAGTALDGYGDTDTLDTLSGFTEGSNFDDHLEGADGNQTFWGGAGEDTLLGNGGDDSLRGGSGDDVLDGGDGVDFANYFNDGQDAAGAGAGATVNLATGTATDNWGNTDTLSNFENVLGSFQADNITGDAGDNIIFSLGGGDTVDGGAGNDTLVDFDGDGILIGGDGDDAILGGRGNDTLTGGNDADTFRFTTNESGDTDFGHDTITDFDVAEDILDLSPFTQYGAIEQLNISEADGNTTITVDGDRSITLNGISAGSLVAANFIFGGEPPDPTGTIGTEGDDILEGSNIDDTIAGLGGNDRIAGLEGDDSLDGGNDSDYVDYSYDPAGVTVDLTNNTATDGWGDTDSLSNFEHIYGSVYADTLTGDAGNNNIVADLNNPTGEFPPPPQQGGNDYIDAGAGDDFVTPGPGVDEAHGGAGFDTLSLFPEINGGVTGTGITVTYGAGYDLTMENTNTGEIENHTGFESIVGTVAGDTVIGNDQDNFFTGIVGNDYFDGGDGIDTFAISGSPSYVDLTLGEAVQDNPILGTVTLLNVENVIGSFNDWDDTLIGNASNNILEGHLGNDTLSGGPGNDTLNGGIATLIDRGTGDPGTNTVDYGRFDNGTGVTVTMTGGGTGTATDAFGDTDTLLFIDNVLGSNYDDILTGDQEDNILVGGDGADTISGNDGDDRISGGAGIDTLDGGDGFDLVNFSDDSIELFPAGGFGTAEGLVITMDPAGTMTASHSVNGIENNIANFEAVVGSYGMDTITGNDQDNFIAGGLGLDTLDGGAGIDTLFHLPTGDGDEIFEGDFIFDLNTGAHVFGGPSTFINFENMIGFSSRDTLIGDSGNNILEGLNGDDIFIGGAGDDVLNGGASILMPGEGSTTNDGFDTVDYSQSSAAVAVNLANESATDGEGGSDTLLSIEGVIGSEFADSLTGNADDNEFQGLGGDDTLTGGGGADVFKPSDDGNDNAAFGHDTITDFDLGDDSINLKDFSGIRTFGEIQGMLSQDGADTLITFDASNTIRLQGITASELTSDHFDFVEDLYIEGTENNDTLNGDEGNDTILGLGGNDQIYGNGGNDNIDGGTGSDQLWGGEGDDVIEGGSDWDNIYGEGGNDILTDSSDGAYISGGDGNDLLTAVNSNANLDGNAGNDTLTGASNHWNELRGGAGDDILIDPDGSGVLFGGSGNDSIDGRANYTEDPAGIFVNLSGSFGDGGSWDALGDGSILVQSRTAIDGWGDTDTLEAGVEQIEGSNFDDFIMAADFTSQGFQPFGGNDTVIGGSGSMWVQVGSGNDYLDGGADWDNLNLWEDQADSAGPQLQGAIVNVSGQDFEYEPGQTAFANQMIDPWGFTDQVFNFESVDGTIFDDVLIGGDEHNWLEGREGNDRLFGGDVDGDNLVGNVGDDYIDGQGGDWDTAWYHQWLQEEVTDEFGNTYWQNVEDAPGIIADLSLGTVQDHYGDTDTLVSIENIEGSHYDDLIIGDGNRNTLRANDGDDVIYGGAGDDSLEGREGNDEHYGEDGDDWLLGQQGDDLLDGGAGIDQVNYDSWSGTTSGINIDMNAITNAGGFNNVVVTPDGFGGTDYLRSIENVSGSDQDDSIIGDGADNQFWGAAGNDILIGGAGNDRLDGSDDFDILDGGAGFDDLYGGENGDLLTGGTEGDVFHFSRFTDQGNPASFGEDVITDFNIAEDALDFNQVPEFSSIEALQGYASEVGPDLVISFISNEYGVDETNSITLQGISLADLPNMNIWYSPLEGTDGADSLTGSAGSDFIQALGGDDLVNAGSGDDHIEGGAGNDILNGDAGNDWFLGGSGSDTIDGGDGWDHVNFDGHSRELSHTFEFAPFGIVIDMNQAQQVVNDGWGSSDTLINIEELSGTNSDDSFTGGAGDDRFSGHDGNDIISGNDGDDFFHGNEGNDNLSGGNGDDWFQPGEGNDVVDGGADWDHLNLDAWQQPGGVTVDLNLPSNQVINDGFGTSDTISGIEDIWGSQHDDIITGNGDDNNLSGNWGNDVINGGDGNDQLNGDQGDDVLNGGDGNDWLHGGEGIDLLDGGAGNDGLQSGDGDDQLAGGAGDDWFLGGQGNDIIDGGDGSDQVQYYDQDAVQGVTVNLATGTATDGFNNTDTLISIEHVLASQMDDTLIGDDNDNSLQGDQGNDQIEGGGGSDALYGNQGNDTIHGGAGNDSLHGGEGDDILNGGLGPDWMHGGAGNDTFIFADGDTNTWEHIEDFNAGAGSEDQIDLSLIASLTDFASVQAAASDDLAGNTQIDLGNGNVLHLQNVDINTLHEDDFIF